MVILLSAFGIVLLGAFAQAVSGFGYGLVTVPLLTAAVDPRRLGGVGADRHRGHPGTRPRPVASWHPGCLSRESWSDLWGPEDGHARTQRLTTPAEKW
ncbi:hypothetical protein [Micromonospora sp. NPDC049301]|uniref:hypothetical protein n=1 Tax=Micromonospora sp. NPDC049301 TaxID=3155723 RepID=UPI003434C97C